MSKTPKKPGDNDVGYGKPPKSGQFRPGQSGNPSGKKKGKGLAHYLHEAGEEEKIFLQDGKKVSMTLNEALSKKVYADAVKGKYQAIKIALDAQKSVAGDAMSPGTTLSGPEEIEVAKHHAEWLKLIEGAENEAGEGDLDE